MLQRQPSVGRGRWPTRAGPPAPPQRVRSSASGQASVRGVRGSGSSNEPGADAARTTSLVAAARRAAYILPLLAAPRGAVRVRVARPRGGAGSDGSEPAEDSSAGPQQQQLPPQQPREPEASGQAPLEPEQPPQQLDAATGSVPLAPATAGSGGGGGLQAGAAGAAGGGSGRGQSTVALLSRVNGVGYTFVLAGFLKIVTLGGLATSAPADAARTAAGKASPYLMVPVGLGLCWVAKQVVDSGLNEDRKFLRIMVGVLLLAYFGLVKLLYKYEPDGEWVRRPRPRLPGPMSELRAQLGDKDLLAGASIADSRAYQPDRPGKELYDDIAWYEGRYPSQLGGSEAQPGSRRGGPSRVSRSLRAAVADSEDDFAGPGAAVDDVLAARQGRQPAAGSPARRSFLDNPR